MTTPPLIEQPSPEQVLSEMRALVERRWPEWSATVETDPAQILVEAIAYRETVIRADFRERMRRSYVQFATGDDLAALARQHGITIAEGESVESIRARIFDAPARYAAAGPLAAYRHWARTVDGVDLVGVTSPSAGTVRVVCAARGDDGDWVAASEAAITAVTAVLSAEERRPATDTVEVVAADPVTVAVTADIAYDAELGGVLDAAEAAVVQWLRNRPRPIGADVPLSGIYAALTVEGVNAVTLTAPAALVAITSDQIAVPGDITLTKDA